MKRLHVKQKPWVDDDDDDKNENGEYAEWEHLLWYTAVSALDLHWFRVFPPTRRTLGQRGLPQISAVRCLELKAETENAQLRCS